MTSVSPVTLATVPGTRAGAAHAAPHASRPAIAAAATLCNTAFIRHSPRVRRRYDAPELWATRAGLNDVDAFTGDKPHAASTRFQFAPRCRAAARGGGARRRAGLRGHRIPDVHSGTASERRRAAPAAGAPADAATNSTPPASEQWVEQQTAKIRSEVEARVARGDMTLCARLQRSHGRRREQEAMARRGADESRARRHEVAV